MSQCLPGSSTPAKVLFFQTSARSCWATVVRFIVMLLLLHLLCFTLALRKKSEATPRLPHGYRGRRVLRRRARSRHRSRLRVANACSTAHLIEPGARRASTHKAWYSLRSQIAGALRCGTCVPRWRCCWHRQGGREPPRTFRSLPVAKGGIEP